MLLAGSRADGGWPGAAARVSGCGRRGGRAGFIHQEEVGKARRGKEVNARPGRHERAAGVVYDEGGADAAFVLLGL